MSMAAVALTAKTERMEARLTPEQKDLLRRAAELEGQTFTDFVISVAQMAAERAIERHQIMRLTAKETQAFVNAYLNPREPGDVLKKYAKRERELFGE